VIVRMCTCEVPPQMTR